MSTILVSGLINVETTLRVEDFPIPYHPVRYPFWGVNTTVSGVGYNVTRALTTLGNSVHLTSLVGKGLYAPLIHRALKADGIPARYVLEALEQTAQSVILYDGEGRRQINVDLKDIQEQSYPSEQFEMALRRCNLAVLCNVNFSRPYLQAAREHGVLVATDVHTIADLEDDYNRDFMAAADVLFMSDELLPAEPEAWIRQVLDRYTAEVVVISLGARGALMAVRSTGELRHIAAVTTRPVVNTIGAGDALFSAFVHSYTRTRDPHAAIEKAVVFASYKIGEKGAAQGFLNAEELDRWCVKVRGQS